MTYKLLAELPNVNYLCTSSYHRYLNNILVKELGQSINSFSIFEQGTVRIYLHDEEWKQVNAKLFQLFLDNPDKLIAYHKTIVNTGISYIQFAKKLKKRNFAKMSTKKLIATFKEFYKEHTKNHHSGLLDALLELYDENISNYIRKILDQKITPEMKINSAESLSTLTTPLEYSTISKEKIDLIKIALELVKTEHAPRRHQNLKDKLIKEHHARYSWMGYMYIGPELKLIYYQKRLDKYMKQKKKLLEDLKKILNKDSLKQEQQKIYEQLQLDTKTRKHIQIAQEILFLKLLRKDSMIHGWHSADSLIKEISKRLKIPQTLIGYFMPYEIEQALTKKIISNLSKRYKLSLTDFQKGKETIIYGDEAIELEKNRITQKENLSLETLKGTCAFSGKARGTVKIVNTGKDMQKVKKRDIIVSYQTNPELIVAMEKAAGIITDKGGLTCHASIVARELKIPCIVGTEHASTLLHDGDEIEMDSEKTTISLVSKQNTVLKGTCAYKGHAKGKAKIVNTPEDMKLFEKGNILVSFSTNPDLIQAMEKSGGIITDRGGVTCHAAIVSRELHIPCLVGTKIATKIIKNGDIVDMDTQKETATIIQKK